MICREANFEDFATSKEAELVERSEVRERSGELGILLC